MRRIKLGLGHTYEYVDGYGELVKFFSVSDIKKRLSRPYDAAAHVGTNAVRMGITEGDVIRRWGISKDIGTSYGSLIDAIVMACLEYIDYRELVRPDSFMYEVARAWHSYYDSYLSMYEGDLYGQCLIGSELGKDRVGLAYGIAGTSDVFIVGEDWYRVLDVKSDGAIERQGAKGEKPGYAKREMVDGVMRVVTKGIRTSNAYGSKLVGIDREGELLDDCEYNIYSFQITLYAILAKKMGGFWHGDEFVSLEGKRYMGGMIAHFNGMTNEFDHYVVSKDMWWTVVASYVKGFIDEVSEGLLCDIG